MTVVKKIITALMLVCSGINFSIAQSAFYDVAVGSGNGLRFWGGSDGYKITMGNTSEYQYGPVTDFSIRTSIDNITGRGWTWGHSGTTNVAAIGVNGNMQIAGSFTALGKIGIGTASPTGNLHIVGSQASMYLQNTNAGDWSFLRIQGSGSNLWDIAQFGNNDFLEFRPNGGNSNRIVMKQSGSMGIGTTTPEAQLEVASSGFGSSTLIFGGIIGTKNPGHELNLVGGKPTDAWPSNQGGHIRLGGNGRGDGDVNVIQFLQNGSEKMRITNGGNVGIGTAAPDQKLTVNGTVHATRVKVETTVPGPDYVFEKSYALPTLDEVKSYIDENRHLPEIPSAKEMEVKGIDVGEMNMLLLRKIEEMTLYMIGMKEQLEKQKDEIKQLKDSAKK